MKKKDPDSQEDTDSHSRTTPERAQSNAGKSHRRRNRTCSTQKQRTLCRMQLYSLTLSLSLSLSYTHPHHQHTHEQKREKMVDTDDISSPQQGNVATPISYNCGAWFQKSPAAISCVRALHLHFCVRGGLCVLHVSPHTDSHTLTVKVKTIWVDLSSMTATHDGFVRERSCKPSLQPDCSFAVKGCKGKQRTASTLPRRRRIPPHSFAFPVGLLVFW